MSKIPLSTYIAYNAPENGKKLLSLYGVKVTTGSQKELAQKLSNLLATNGESALFDMANLHPDKELVVRTHEINESHKNGGTETMNGCDGKCSKCGGQSNFTATPYPYPGTMRMGDDSVKSLDVYGFNFNGEYTRSEGKIPLVLFGGLALILGYMISKG